MNEERIYRILIAEHEKEDLQHLQKIAAFEPVTAVDIAETASETVIFIDYHAYDLIIANAGLPGMNGSALITYAKQSFLNSNTPVVLHYANRQAYDPYQDPLRGQVLDVIDQPLRKVSLEQHIRQYFRFIQREREIQDQLKLETKKRELLGVENEIIRENFRNIVEKSNAGILIVDHEGIIRFTNEITQQIFLRRQEELVGSPFGIVIDENNKTEITIVRKNGDIGVGEISTAPSQWKGQPAQLILISDITEHKKLQEHLEVAKERAQESDRLKTAFLANMSHEIRTPLNGILGFSQLLEQEELSPEKKRSFLNSISSCGNHLLTIISDIIDIAQIEAGQLKISNTDFDVIALIKEVHQFFSFHKKVQTNNLQLRLHLPGPPSLTIHSDASRIRQILVNLVNNAIKYTDQGFVEIGLTLSNPDQLLFYVLDSGIGIPAREFEDIFKRFRQVEETKERLNEGNGLGLSISKALTELLGGKIGLESREGEGSRFYFTIPVHTEPASEQPGQATQQPPRQKELKGKKVLVVEDDELNFLLIQSVIKDMGTTILWAKDGAEAVNIASREHVDLILMDMKLPVMNGYEATRKIRNMFPNLPIIAQTAYAMGGDRDKVLAAGCNDYISKPIQINELMFKVNNYFN